MELKDIDFTFDYTSDSPKYWDNFWNNNYGFGGGGSDPDAKSPMLRKVHQALWSRELPNGEKMVLVDGRSKFYLKWEQEQLWFGSDSITASFRNYRGREIIEKVKATLPNYNTFVENYIHKLYEIGGLTILPSFSQCLNQRRGCHPKIWDRWDLTLECIRLHYAGDKSHPLAKCLDAPQNVRFFSKFIDFKGFVDFFFFQDMVSEDYSKVNLWLESNLFESNPIPKTVESYLDFISKEIEFVDKRTKRIKEFCQR